MLDEPIDFLDRSHFGNFTAKYYEPILEAFSIEYAILKVHDFIEESPRKELLLDEEFQIDGPYIYRSNYIGKMPGSNSSPALIIHYHGVKDYSKLFPAINDHKIREVLGKYYEEAENNFESRSWLSFILMCGGIFEGLLENILNKKYRSFNNIVNDAYKGGYINELEYKLIADVKDQRNLVHPRRAKSKYITRSQAMDIRKVLDDMIVRFSKYST